MTWDIRRLVITQRVGVNNMSHKRQNIHQFLVVPTQKMRKDSEKWDYRRGHYNQSRWRQVKKAEDERMLREWKK